MVKLDIACGQNKTPGFKGIDLSGDADIQHDLFKTPWPIKSNTVTEAVCNHFVEHIPHYLPEFNGRDGWWVFFDEVWRCMKPGSSITVTTPFAMNERAFWDPTHVRYITPTTFYYLTEEWRTAQGLDHYPITADFEVVTMSAPIADHIQTRNEEYQSYARQHYWNVLSDLTVILRKRKKK